MHIRPFSSKFNAVVFMDDIPFWPVLQNIPSVCDIALKPEYYFQAMGIATVLLSLVVYPTTLLNDTSTILHFFYVHKNESAS